MQFFPNSICVNGSYIAADVYGQRVIQDDDGDLWLAVPVETLEVRGKKAEDK